MADRVADCGPTLAQAIKAITATAITAGTNLLAQEAGPAQHDAPAEHPDQTEAPPADTD
jgi:hypothetical protein